jgi:shikimate kinase
VAPIVVLIGFMGSGKTTVGRRVARLLGWDFVDLDHQVEAEAGCSIPDIFAREGEARFRERECAALRGVMEREPAHQGTVVALGGGTVTSPEAVECVRARALVVYLEADAVTTWERVKTSDRPLARDAGAFTALFEERQRVYERTAHTVVPVCGRTPAEIACQVASIARAWVERQAMNPEDEVCR